MAIMTTPSGLGNLSLTRVIKNSGVQHALRAYLPQTRRYLAEINRSVCNELKIAPSPWVKRHNRYACVGTAFDYLVGLLWANKSDTSTFEKLFQRVIERMESKCVIHVSVRAGTIKRISPLGDPETTFSLRQSLRDLILSELPSVRNQKTGKRPRDFFRGLGLLADLDAMARSAAVPVPTWISSSKFRGANDLREALRKHYPDQFVDELQLLIRAAHEDLPSGLVEYNPIFGARAGRIAVGADGDLIIDDLLLELKVSIKPFQPHHLWQLLGYAALDANRGNQRIRRAGLYNPRYRGTPWSQPIDRLVGEMGGTDFERFRRWFNADIEKTLLKAA